MIKKMFAKIGFVLSGLLSLLLAVMYWVCDGIGVLYYRLFSRHKVQHGKGVKSKFNQNIYSWLMLLIFAVPAILVIGKDSFNWDMLFTKILNLGVYTVVLVMFGFYWRSKHFDETNKISGDPIAVSIYLSIYGLGAALILALS